MKNITALLILSFLMTLGLQGQDQKRPTNGKVDTTTVSLGDRSTILYIRKKEPLQDQAYFKETLDGDVLIGRETGGRKKRRTYWTGIDLGINMISDGAGNYGVPANPNWSVEPIKSLYWGINFAKLEGRLFGNNYVMTGLGLNYRSFSPANLSSIKVTRDTTYFMDTTNTLNPTKTKLRATYLQIPALFNINTSRSYKKNFHIAVGFLANIRIGSMFKEKHKINGNTQKDKIKDDFNFNPVLMDFTARVGYSSFTVFVNYSLNPLFRDGTSINLYPLSFGVQLIGF